MKTLQGGSPAGIDLGYDSVAMVSKNESLGYQVIKLRDHTVISFESIPACDRQTDGRTDGQTDTPPMFISRSSIAQRDENPENWAFLHYITQV